MTDFLFIGLTVLVLVGGVILWVVAYFLRKSRPRISKWFFATGLIYNIIIAALLIAQMYSHRDYKDRSAEAYKRAEERQREYEKSHIQSADED